jgi:hypothetical protein
MSGASFLRVKKLKVAGIIQLAARHNLREIQAEQGASGPIDATRIHLNQTLAGAATADDVAQHAKDLMQAASVVNLRKDAVMALELVLSLPVATTIDVLRYFADCLRWVQSHFDCPVLSAVVHLDEAAPHCHILLLPLRDGRMVGNKLIGGRPQLLAMQTSFHEAVAASYGLRKSPARLAGTSKHAAVAMVLARLKETGDSALQSDVWASIRDCIENAPERFLEALSMVADVKTKAPRTMAQIFTSTGKGPKRESHKIATTSNAIAFAESPNAIAFQPKASPMKSAPSNAIALPELQSEKVQRLCSVAFAQNKPPVSPRFKPNNPKVALRSDGKVTVTVDDDGVILDVDTPPAEVIHDDDGITRVREHVEFADNLSMEPSWAE